MVFFKFTLVWSYVWNRWIPPLIRSCCFNAQKYCTMIKPDPNSPFNHEIKSLRSCPLFLLLLQLQHLLTLQHPRSLVFTALQKLIQPLIAKLSTHFLYYRRPVTQHAAKGSVIAITVHLVNSNAPKHTC